MLVMGVAKSARVVSPHKLPVAPVKSALPANNAMLPVILVTLNRILVALLVIPAKYAILATCHVIPASNVILPVIDVILYKVRDLHEH
jgi:hypothetical protein